MSIVDSFLVALMAIRTNTLRSVLTALGIIIGVASVIVMVAVGSGARSEVEKRIASLGTNQLQLYPGSSRVRGRAAGSGTNLPLSESDLTAIKQRLPGIVAMTGIVSRAVTVVRGNQNWLTNAYGVHPDYLVVRDWTLTTGRNFTLQEEKTARKVIVVGETVAKQLFGEQDAIGQSVRILNSPFQIIGVLESKGQSTFGRDQDDVILMPMSVARGRIVGTNKLVPDYVGSISMKFDDNADLATSKTEIEDLMRKRRRIRPGQEDNFYVRDLAEFLRTRTAAQNTLSLLLGATAAISLIVGGIGIMNIMLVSVTERTREIGLRMAVGARRRDIMVQFLVEAVTLCMLGGAAGIAIGVTSAIATAKLAEWPVLISPDVVLLAIAAAAATGIFFGFFPARRAAHLNPIDALRTE